MARDRYQTRRSNPLLAWVTIGVLLAGVVGLLAIYVLRPGRSPADEARTAAAVRNMDDAQSAADARREERRTAAAL